jgi:hypothetical protein
VSTTGWILLIALFLGAHLLMHRGHRSHGRPPASSRAPNGHEHDGEVGDEVTTAAGQTERHRHSGC